MKSRRAEQVLQAASFTNEYGYQYVCIDSAYAAVELAERDARKGNSPLPQRVGGIQATQRVSPQGNQRPEEGDREIESKSRRSVLL